jgi:crotonobetainyl-CoA:carnitine CoA-transferase CaiB-like acyl-CoA transferase
VFQVADGHLILAVGNDQQFERLCTVAGCAQLARDERFASNAQRVRHRDTLVPMLAERLRRRSRADWLAALEAAKVPCGPINDLDDVFADPQVRARGMKVTVAHPHHDALDLVASPMKLSATPAQVRRPPPLLGQHTDEVLAEIGIDAAARQRLREAGVIGAAPGRVSP